MKSADNLFDKHRVGDAPVLPDLLDQIPADQPLGMVTADGAYDTRACHAAIAARGAAAVIPPRRNGKLWKEPTPGAMVRNEALRSCRRLGRAIWKRWTGYHRRSLSRDSLVGQRIWFPFEVQGLDGVMDGPVEDVCVGEGLMGEIVGFQVSPDGFDVVEFGRIFGQPLNSKPMVAGGQRGPGRLAGMDRAVVEHDDDGSLALA